MHLNRLKLNDCTQAAAAMLVLLATTAPASETEHREHGAHEHGRGLLNVVVEGNELVIEFEMPGVNVVGFEHEPGTDEEKHAVEEALETFAKADALFVPSANAKCRAEKAEVELAGLQHEKGEHHTGEHSGEHSEHESKSEHAKHEEEGHSELHAQYVFHCDAPDALENLEVRLFDHLRDVEEIDVQLVTPTIQTAMELHMTSAVLRLAQK